MKTKIFLYLWLAVAVSGDLQSLCQSEMTQDLFPISCFRWFRSRSVSPSSSSLRHCREWSSRQKDERLLTKTVSSEVVPSDCKTAAQRQIDLLRYQQGLTD